MTWHQFKVLLYETHKTIKIYNLRQMSLFWESLERVVDILCSGFYFCRSKIFCVWVWDSKWLLAISPLDIWPVIIKHRTFHYCNFWQIEIWPRDIWPRDIWPFDHMDIWPYGHLTIWTFDHMDIWPYWHLTIWIFDSHEGKMYSGRITRGEMTK